ncbi:putative phosphatase PhoE [Paraliobacillus quinghaiensis]|uniref:Phosphatase PhoE n=1 Tax=Paraliobacillus quinghaiensis TaxID=470815 RepID=A0A917TST7_9BACI|nr:histidine phosphatase family protein [Paraliobacillus quinghaiensis]GGM36485.1 putative phosphatase PhoE [Paraliobacillus quinghaiensis]
MICLVRHGETDWNLQGKIQGSTDIPLNETGIKQAEACSSYFEGSDWDIIVSSPMKRAKQTAEIINQKLQVDVVERHAFKERGFGDAEGLTLEERLRLFPNHEYPNQELKQDFIKRVMGGMEEINQRFPNKKVLVVAHGAVIHSLLNEMAKEQIDFMNTKLANACISHVQYIVDKWHVHNYNQIDHLENVK